MSLHAVQNNVKEWITLVGQLAMEDSYQNFQGNETDKGQKNICLDLNSYFLVFNKQIENSALRNKNSIFLFSANG